MVELVLYRQTPLDLFKAECMYMLGMWQSCTKAAKEKSDSEQKLRVQHPLNK